MRVIWINNASSAAGLVFTCRLRFCQFVLRWVSSRYNREFKLMLKQSPWNSRWKMERKVVEVMLVGLILFAGKTSGQWQSYPSLGVAPIYSSGVGGVGVFDPASSIPSIFINLLQNVIIDEAYLLTNSFTRRRRRCNCGRYRNRCCSWDLVQQALKCLGRPNPRIALSVLKC